MTSMAILYLRKLGQPLGALSTTVPGDPPVLGPASTQRVAVPVPDPSAAGPSIPRPVTFERDDLAVVVLEAEFDDPLDVFQWRVVTTQGTDGSEQHHLDRLGTGKVIATGTSSGLDLLLDVPKLGDEARLDFEVRNQVGVTRSGTLVFGANDTRQKTNVNVPDTGVYVVFVEGYPPTVPARLTVTRTPAAGQDLLLDVPRLGDKLQLPYEVRSTVTQAAVLNFAPADARQTVTVVMPDKSAADVIVEGYPPMTVPAVP
jgi:hypothetical protein